MPVMDDRFADSLRAALIDHVETAATRRPTALTSRRKIAAMACSGLVVAAAGGAFAAGLFTQQPGAPVSTALASPVTASGQGTQTIELGAQPAGADHLDLAVTCLTAGTFATEDGATLVCDTTDVGSPRDTMYWRLARQPGQHETRINAGVGQRWRLIATYTTVHTSAWGVNRDGKTFGVQNEHGMPDLVAVIATNGRTGYCYANELELTEHHALNPSEAGNTPNTQPRTIAVYASDGKTRIGDFTVN